nr:polysaccharide pyruvyl transferase family protein [Maliibacterium massiliense]
MRKIGIITLNGYYPNLGNNLQNYALQQALRSLGCFAETIINRTSYQHRRLATAIKYVLNYQHYRQQWVNSKEGRQFDAARIKAYEAFRTKYISLAPFSIARHQIPAGLSQRYDYFIAGSDQIWNPYFRATCGIDFLTFASPKQRISYAASFGVSEIPQKYQSQFTQWLSGIDYISVREESGAAIVKALTGRDIPVVLDPTMLITQAQWLQIAQKPSWFEADKTPYMLTYFLGDSSAEREYVVKQIAQERGLRIINLLDQKNLNWYTTTPDQFIWLIKHASFVCTDSFHGSVFCILLQTAFGVIARVTKHQASMHSRISTLLGTFSLEDHFIEKGRYNTSIFRNDFTHTLSVLEVERTRAYQYLKQALNIKDE